MQTIGFLLPRSNFYQSISFDLHEGLRSGLKQIGRDDIRIVTENIGYGSDKQICYRAAEKLLMEENASVIVAYIGHRSAQLLRPLFLATNKILIVLDAGAHLPDEWTECPNIIYHSLHNSFGAFLASKRAVKDGCLTGGMVTGYYDGGYLQTVAIFNGFQNAGGTICFNHATGHLKEEFTVLPLKNHLEQFPGSAFLSVFSGEFAQWYFSMLKEIFERDKIAVYLPPFGLEEIMLNNAAYPGNNVKGVAAWSRNIESKENSLFMNTIHETNKTPNLFSLISWECAHIVAKTLDLIKEHKSNVHEITFELKKIEFEGPRGKIYFHQKTNTTIAPLYEATIVLENSNACKLRIDSKISPSSEDFDKLLGQQLDGVNSAWYNSYICI